MNFGELVKDLRIAKQLTLRQGCAELGLDPSNRSKMERGVTPRPRDPTLLERWAKFFGLSGDKQQEFLDLASLARQEIPPDVASDKTVIAALPAFFRAVRGPLGDRVLDRAATLRALAPILGADAVRAQVAADLDFSRIERTTEAFDPEFSVVRSEQISEDESRGGGMMGVPGALTNQPPEAGVIAEEGNGANGQAQVPGSSSRRTVRNYEVDRTVSHIREAPGGLRRLSIAVVVDHKEERNEAGELERVPFTEQEMERITTLVREAVGFDARRGDSINVINASFRPVEALELPPEPPIWQEPWVVDLAKTILAVIMVIVLALTVVRPLLKGLAERGAAARREDQLGHLALPEGELGEEQLRLGQQPQVQGALPGPNTKKNYEDQLDSARGMVREDPKRVAQLMKTWIASDGAGA